LAPRGAQAQDYSVLRINEVISDNESQGPADSSGSFLDMVEIYNGGDQTLALGTPNSTGSLALSDTAEQPPENQLWRFQSRVSTISAKGFLVVFLDDAPDDALTCELYTGFGLPQGRCEPLTLWGPAGEGGVRPILDQIWVPPLEEDVSLGRYPDGAGPAPLPVEQTLAHLRFNPPGATSFGTCGTSCPVTGALCRGAANGPGGNIAPRIHRDSHSTNSPAAGEPVEIVARVEDDKDPLAPNIQRAWLRYWLGGELQPEIDLVHDGSAGIQTGGVNSCVLERWTLWRATIPGQPAGTRVDFTLHVQDAEGLQTSDPLVLCPEGVGPCDDLGLPGPSCIKEPSPGLQYVPCSAPLRYLSGYELPASLRALVINELVANQTNVLPDPGDPGDFEDFFELLNTSDAAVDLSGLWLSDKAFSPLGWQFPAGSSIGPGQRLIIWTDAEGGRCPRPPKLPGDGQDCPDPTDPARSSYHTNFALEADGDELYLFDRSEAGLGVIHGVEFGPQAENQSYCLVPDGDRDGEFQVCPPTPGAPNPTPNPTPKFLRGDANSDCRPNITDAITILDHLFKGEAAPGCPDAADADDNGVLQITDPIFLLQYLFQGGPAPPDPGPETAGPDPTPDVLDRCVDSGCG
jgi:hypothetical protein